MKLLTSLHHQWNIKYKHCTQGLQVTLSPEELQVTPSPPCSFLSCRLTWSSSSILKAILLTETPTLLKRRSIPAPLMADVCVALGRSESVRDLVLGIQQSGVMVPHSLLQHPHCSLLLFPAPRLQFTLTSTQTAVYSSQHPDCSLLLPAPRLQFTLPSTQTAVYSSQHPDCSLLLFPAPRLQHTPTLTQLHKLPKVRVRAQVRQGCCTLHVALEGGAASL